ncbi:MAG: DUF86 domain-containing protein [Bacteroidales bacterium]
MTRPVSDYLKDIKREIDFLLHSTQGKDFKSFINDEVLTRATERSLEIIGEAVKYIPIEIRNTYPIVDWKDMAGMRDKLIHHYFGIDHEIVWSVIQTEIPELKEAIEVILKKI